MQCQDGGKLKRCAGCKKRLYCSRECQMNHFPKHATNCSAVYTFREAQKAEEAEKVEKAEKKTGVPKPTTAPIEVRSLNW